MVVFPERFHQHVQRDLPHVGVFSDETSAPDIVGVDGAGVLWCAPHACWHDDLSGLHRKLPDLGTGELVVEVATRTTTAALVASGAWRGNANADPFEVCQFKQRAFELADRNGMVVVDVHGMRDLHGVDVCIGTAGTPCSRAANAVVDACEQLGLSWAVDWPFSATRKGTVAATMTDLGVQAVQVELSRWLRVDRHGMTPLSLAVALLCDVAQRLRHPGHEEAAFDS